MEIVYEQLLGQGILGVFLILVIIYFLRKERKAESDAVLKSKAWSELVEAKDNKIEELNNKIHEIGIEAVTAVKEFTAAIKGI